MLDLLAIRALLEARDIRLEEGLTDDEVSRVEATFDFRFPPDLRELLQYMLPVDTGFPNWRNDSHEELIEFLDWPIQGICFDIEHNVFWLDEWGSRPTDVAEACQVATLEVAKVPKLIPVYGHRYLPADPCLRDNPVFSVWQTDIIYYGADLSDYFACEFLSKEVPHYDKVRKIRFWSYLVEDHLY